MRMTRFGQFRQNSMFRLAKPIDIRQVAYMINQEIPQGKYPQVVS